MIMPSEKIQIAEQILQNPKSGAAAVGGLAAVGLDHWVFQALPDIITIVGGVLGIVLTSLMIVSKWLEIRNKLKD